MSLGSNILGVALDQNTHATNARGEIAALRQLLDPVELKGLLVQADALHANRPLASPSPPVIAPAFVLDLVERGADLLIAVKHRRRLPGLRPACRRHSGFQVIRDHVTYGKRAPLQTSKREGRHGRDITWTLLGLPSPQWLMEKALPLAVGIAEPQA
ncbi:MAG: hypothetical protein ACK5N0_00880 [Synechococcaceae cyanobacterium]